MWKFYVQYIKNSRVRSITLAFFATTETEARKLCDKFLSDFKETYPHAEITKTLKKGA